MGELRKVKAVWIEVPEKNLVLELEDGRYLILQIQSLIKERIL